MSGWRAWDYFVSKAANVVLNGGAKRIYRQSESKARLLVNENTREFRIETKEGKIFTGIIDNYKVVNDAEGINPPKVGFVDTDGNVWMFADYPGYGDIQGPNSASNYMISYNRYWGYSLSYHTVVKGGLLNSPEPSWVASSGTSVPDPCFLAGTLIRTPSGQLPVEELVAGDEIIVWRDGQDCVEAIRWVGRGYASVSAVQKPGDEAGFAICFQKGSLGSERPSLDLRVTAEHCMYIDEVFVPARMLVNDMTIYYDKEKISYIYFHIEIEKHGVIYANDAQTETYLDTNNRLPFMPDSGSIYGNGPTNPGSRHLSWHEDACAPLETHATVIQPIWERLVPSIHRRFIQTPLFTSDPELHLELDDGVCIYPQRRRENTYVFRIPSTTSRLYILSRCARPCDIIGPYIDDRRYFGVLIGDMSIWDDRGMQHCPLADIAAREIGWHDCEIDGGYWTTGRATCSLPSIEDSYNDFVMLSLVIRQCAHFLSDEQDRAMLSPPGMKVADWFVPHGAAL